MSPEPEKRSDGPAEKPRCDHHWVAHLQPDLPDPVRSVEVCSLCGTINGAEIANDLAPLLAALAASRADAEQLRADNERISAAWAEVIQREQRTDNAALHDVQEARAEAAAARVEVSQLRAKIEAERDQHQCSDRADMFGGYECGHCGDSYATTVGCINKQRLNALLAEPLGSTPSRVVTTNVDDFFAELNQPTDMCHNGHEFSPGIQASDPDPTWCNTCGEPRRLGSTEDPPATEEKRTEGEN